MQVMLQEEMTALKPQNAQQPEEHLEPQALSFLALLVQQSLYKSTHTDI
jgi:hypothetical protein